jgi:hypothetical protein
MSVLSREERHFASKPLACSSPIVAMKDGVQVRVHDGHTYGYGQYLIGPSTHPVDQALQPVIETELQEILHKLEEV